MVVVELYFVGGGPERLPALHPCPTLSPALPFVRPEVSGLLALPGSCLPPQAAPPVPPTVRAWSSQPRPGLHSLLRLPGLFCSKDLARSLPL